MPASGPLLAGRFRVGARLGAGAQAETFLATDDKSPGTPQVVVKRMTLRGGWKSFDLFEREARVLAGLRHPGIPRHIATFEEPPGTFNLVMQHMPGENLRQLAAKRSLSELELRDVLARTLEILDYLHGRVPPVVHRDIKPSNLIRARDGAIALVDFGGVLDAARDKGGSTIVGTFGYMAPEQLHGQATPATDLYALGATIVALAGGIEPEDVPRKGLRMDLGKHLPALDPAFRAALVAMTEPDPDQRPQRARDVMALVAKAKPPKPARAAPSARAQPPAPRPARRMFADVQEPVGTFLRLSVLAFSAAGWLGMEVLRWTILVLAYALSPLAFRKRRAIVAGAREVTGLLEEGREGFADLARSAIARDRPRQLPPPDP